MTFDQCGFQPLEAPGLEGPVVVATDVVFGRGGQDALMLDLYRPAGHAHSPLPVVVFIHGGGWHGGDKESYRDLAARVASNGYLCASVNYRLSGDTPFPAALEDCTCAVRSLRASAEALGADAARFAAWGHSAGGHLAAMVALAPGRFEGAGGCAEASSRVQCALCYSAPLDLPALGENLRASVDHFLGITGPDRAGVRDQASPITYAAGSAAAFFVCHGAQDDLVPIDQSERFVEALRKAGAPVEFLPVGGAGHDLERYSEDIFARALEFLDRHLKQGSG
jgi:acetyl esterase/lipase